MICNLFSEPSFFFYVSELPSLLYYSHLPVGLLALFVGLFVFVNNPKEKLNQLLFLITVTFALWLTINLTAWTNIHSDIILTVWPFFGVTSAILSILCIYFIYVFAHKKEPSLRFKVSLLLLTLPVILFAHTDLSVTGFNITDCDAFGFEGLLYHTYYSSLGIVAMIWSAAILIKKYKTSDRLFRKQILLMGVGIEFFLFSFYTIVFLASFIANLGLTTDSELEFYGMFGMGIFIVFIGVLLTQFKTFKVGILAAQAFVVGLITVIASQFTFSTSKTSTILTAVTLALTAILSYALIRSVKKEIKQREELELLTQELERANIRLKELDKQKSEFVSIASHQLRSPLTAMRGYASMLYEGSYGKLPEKAVEVARRIEESAKLMAMSVEDYLNVSRIESGNMKYNLSDFNLRDMVETICDDLRPEALKKGLILLFRSDIEGKGIVNADVGKTNQIIHNLINNSLKYTPKGSINVFVRDDSARKRIYINITDTGIGMSKETAAKLFHKFTRADNANSVNVSGTGLGLFVALKMAEAMGGTITAESEGDGKGSTFTIELPLAM
jgi:signal transduction histidine kinase